MASAPDHPSPPPTDRLGSPAGWGPAALLALLAGCAQVPAADGAPGDSVELRVEFRDAVTGGRIDDVASVSVVPSGDGVRGVEPTGRHAWRVQRRAAGPSAVALTVADPRYPVAGPRQVPVPGSGGAVRAVLSLWPAGTSESACDLHVVNHAEAGLRAVRAEWRFCPETDAPALTRLDDSGHAFLRMPPGGHFVNVGPPTAVWAHPGSLVPILREFEVARGEATPVEVRIEHGGSILVPAEWVRDGVRELLLTRDGERLGRSFVKRWGGDGLAIPPVPAGEWEVTAESSRGTRRGRVTVRVGELSAPAE